MKSLNRVQLIGRLGSDPECKDHNGKMVSKFSIATGEEWIDKSTSEKHDYTEWHKVVCFNKLAEIVKTYVKKGARIYISGKLKTSTWQNKSNENRSITEIVVDELIMLDGKQSESES